MDMRSVLALSGVVVVMYASTTDACNGGGGGIEFLSRFFIAQVGVLLFIFSLFSCD